MSVQAPSPEPIIRLRGLDKRFPRQRTWSEVLRHPLRRDYLPALRSVSLDIYPGEFFGLLGPNGAGKTTLFKILATLVLPEHGSATVSGLDVARDPGRVRAVLTPVIASERSLFWRLSAQENLRLFAGLYGLPAASAQRRIRDVLGVVGLGDTGAKLVGTFSSGMKQRLLIGRALLGDPRVLLLDEPTRSLDPLLAREFRRFLREEVGERQKCTVLLATHSAEEALELCTRVGVLHQGRLLAVGTVEELGAQFGDDHYRLMASAGASVALQTQAERGRVTQIEEGEPDAHGWRRFEVRIPGGRPAAASVLASVTASGAEVGHFERVEPSLADLLERVVRRSDEDEGSAASEAEGEQRDGA